jgi:hypothetical protein
MNCKLLLPATTKCSVELHETLVLGAARPGECKFSGKERPLAVQDFEISGGPSRIAPIEEADGFLQVRNLTLLANPDLMEFLVADQCVGYIPKRTLNCLSIGDQGLFVLRLGYPQISAQRSSRENRLAHLRAVRPGSKLRAH